MKKNSCCECCGGNLKMLGKHYIKCEYCGQIYLVTEDDSLSFANVEDVYQNALKLKKSSNRENLKEAASLFGSLGAYEDSDIQTTECFEDIRRIEIEEEEKRLSQLRREEQEKYNRQKQAQRNKKIGFYFVTILAGMVACLIIVFGVSTSYKKAREEKYVTALAAYEEENYEEALRIFEELKDYNDALTYVADIRKLMEESQKVYEEAKVLYEVKEYGRALEGFSAIRFYSDSKAYIEQINDAIMQDARELFETGDYNNAKELIALIPKDSEQYYTSIALGKEIEEAEKVAEEARQAAILLENYNKAIELYNASDYISAQSIFMELNGYEQATEYLDKIGNALYEEAKVLYDTGDYLACAERVKYIDDSVEWVNHMLANDLLEKAKSDYTNRVNSEANSILINENYDAMCVYLKAAVCELYTAWDATVMIEEYKPVLLSSLDVFSGGIYSGGDFKYQSGIVDNMGNNHMNVLTHGPNEYSYYVGGEYTTISGIGFIFKEHATTRDTMKLIIYGDNKEELYHLEMTGGDFPQDFCVNIEGVQVLTIYFDGYFYNAFAINYYDFAGIGEFSLNKAP